MAQVLTIEAAILDRGVCGYLSARAAEYQCLLHRLHVEVNGRGKPVADVVKAMLRTEGWTARQLNALRIQLEGMARAWKEGLERRIKGLSDRIGKLEEVISKESDKNARHQRQRKRAKWKKKLSQWQGQLESGKPNFCFGGRKLFKAQYHLKENGYRDHEAWLMDWRSVRSDSFMLIGKAADANGCSDCRLEVVQASTESLAVMLRLRKLNREMPPGRARPQDYIHIPVVFRYNIPQILAAIAAEQPMNYQFFRRDGEWRVHLITRIPDVQRVSDLSNGSLGIDLNPECIATAQVKADGNPSQLVSYDLLPGSRTANQTKDELGKIVAQVVDRAVAAEVPIVIERLEFRQIQKELQARGLNRRLSRFKFSLFETMLRTRAAKQGIQVFSVNPAYSSIIGYFKFGYGNGLNRHESAAIAIARRIQRPGGGHFSERIRFRTQHPEAPDPKTLLPPATDGNRHPWKGWRKLGNLLAKSTRYGKSGDEPCPAGGGFREEDDLDYSPSVTTVPESDKPRLLQPQPAKRSDRVIRTVCDSSATGFDPGSSTVTE